MEDNGKFFMMDGGCSCDVEKVKNYLEEINYSIHDLKIVIVTHAHPDHSGGANKFSKKYGIQIAGPKKLNDWYRGFSGFVKFWVDLALGYMVGIRKTKRLENMLFRRRSHLDLILNDGDHIPGFSDWKILSCPGHTDMDLTILNEKEKLAYIADNLVGSGEKVFRPYPISKPIEYKKSLKRYLDFGVEKFLLAHYGEQKISKERIQFLIDTTPNIPRIHKNTLGTIFIHLMKSILKR